jgi:hypothetical protein
LLNIGEDHDIAHGLFFTMQSFHCLQVQIPPQDASVQLFFWFLGISVLNQPLFVGSVVWTGQFYSLNFLTSLSAQKTLQERRQWQFMVMPAWDQDKTKMHRCILIQVEFHKI